MESACVSSKVSGPKIVGGIGMGNGSAVREKIKERVSAYGGSYTPIKTPQGASWAVLVQADDMGFTVSQLTARPGFVMLNAEPDMDEYKSRLAGLAEIERARLLY